MVCHGALVVSGGVVPDLRRLTAEKHSIFQQIVFDGVIHTAGMPRMGDLVTPQDVHDIQAYIAQRAREDRAAVAAAAATVRHCPHPAADLSRERTVDLSRLRDLSR